ncbi:hypothetical protein JCM9140_2440 [Halalkalibacter wakoensis JCM 9140]|uniref:ABM domain-containing protein n=1 Tax=Halalkalibacter wakoensis JCM 9140 TaxID=1236970 RepID=W4Q4U8_9BACI|nr:hypothetical protein [Halalkalibacter wakoensis]GAE26384.1 hypothetical protein JCM9140_2440 [Halalkalibacter wakoensis JCM 9140]
MTKPLQIFMEYKVNKNQVHEYEQAMKEIIEVLPEYEATNIQWFVGEEDQPYLYVEMFEVPTISHYEVIKNMRRSAEHSTFGKIVPFIDGGAEKIHCWAFKRKES